MTTQAHITWHLANFASRVTVATTSCVHHFLVPPANIANKLQLSAINMTVWNVVCEECVNESFACLLAQPDLRMDTNCQCFHLTCFYVMWKKCVWCAQIRREPRFHKGTKNNQQCYEKLHRGYITNMSYHIVLFHSGLVYLFSVQVGQQM